MRSINSVFKLTGTIFAGLGGVFALAGIVFFFVNPPAGTDAELYGQTGDGVGGHG